MRNARRNKLQSRDVDAPEAPSPSPTAAAVAPLQLLAEALADSEGSTAPSAVRAAVEAVTGRGLSDVRVHSGGGLSSAVDALDATALAVGRDVVLGSRAPSAASPEGFELLAHELGHTAQAAPADGPLALGGRTTRLEAQADGVAAAAVAWRHGVTSMGSIPLSPTTGVLVQRDPPPRERRSGGGLAALATILRGGDLGELTFTEATEGEGGQGAVIHWGPVEMRTWADVAQVLPYIRSQVTSALEGLRDEAVLQRGRELNEGIDGWQSVLSGMGSSPVTRAGFNQLSLWRDEFRGVLEDCNRARRATALTQLRDARRVIDEQAAAVQAAEPELAEQLRRQYRTGSTSAIAQASSQIGTALDVGLGLRDLSREIGSQISGLGGPTVPPASRYIGFMQAANRFLAAANLMMMNSPSGAPTELSAATQQLENLGTMFSSGATLLNVAPHIGLYANLYLGPALQVIGSQLRVIEEALHGQNRVARAALGPDMVNWAVEPGGRAMYDFMIEVMRAGAEGSVPTPPEAVATYFFDHRDALQAAAGQEVPIRGIYGFRSLDPAAFSRWIHAHRQRVWQALYGSWDVPDERGRVRRLADGAAGPPTAFDDATRGAWSAIPYRAEMEARFGEDFGGVRSWLGQAAPMRQLGARAAARGEDVAFASASPDRRTVAHELAHVVQHRRSGFSVLGGVSEPGDAAEREAEALAGGSSATVRARPTAGVHLDRDPSAPDVGGMETITATAEGEVSRGRFTDRILALMRREPGLRFVDAARRVASGDRPVRGEHPVRSGRLGTDDPLADPPLRQAIVVSVSQFSGGDLEALPDVASATAPQGPLTRALRGDYGAGNLEVVREPTAEQARARIRAAIDRLAGQLTGTQSGELLVNLQSHGSQGGISGSDGGDVSVTDFEALGDYARSRGVRLVVVADACEMGLMTARALDRGAQDLSREVESSGLPEAERERLTTLLSRSRSYARLVQWWNQSLSRLLDVSLGDAGASAGRPAAEEIRSWLRIYGAEIFRDPPILSQALATDLRTLFDETVRQEPAVSTRAQVTALRVRIVRIIDRLMDELGGIQEWVRASLDLRALDR